jgi:hypothetical protein
MDVKNVLVIYPAKSTCSMQQDTPQTEIFLITKTPACFR